MKLISNLTATGAGTFGQGFNGATDPIHQSSGYGSIMAFGDCKNCLVSTVTITVNYVYIDIIFVAV
jgi:hypothetical protein